MLFLLLAMLVVVPAAAAAVEDAASRDAAVMTLEKSMWEMWKQKDAQSFGALLAEDFHDIYLSGEPAGKEELMRGFADSDLLDYSLGPMHVAGVSEEVRLLVYRAHVHGRVSDKEVEYDVDVTSAWAKRNGSWKSVFYRETLVPKTLPWSNLAP
jgi:hypothetical protein